MAGDALAGEGKTHRDLTAKQKRGLREEHGVTHRGVGGTQFYNKEGGLEDIGEDNNPFKVKDLSDFDASAYGRGAARGQDWINGQDVKRLHSEGGFSAEEMAEAFKDMKIKGGAARFLEKQGATVEGGGGSGGGGGGGGDNGGGVDLPPPDDDTNNPGIPTNPGTGGNGSITQIQDNDNIQDNSNNSGTINTNIDNSQQAMMGMGSSYGDADDFMASFKKKYNFFE